MRSGKQERSNHHDQSKGCDMYEEVIYYSLFNDVDGRLCSALSLLYDRVTIPYVDFAVSNNHWAHEFIQSCPAAANVVNNTRFLRDGNYAVCAPLTEKDTPLIAYSNSDFNDAFHDYRRAQGVTDELWLQTLDKSLFFAYATLNSFLTSSVLKTRDEQGKECKLLVVADKDSSYRDNMQTQIAGLLGASLQDFVVPRIEVVPEGLERLRERLRDLESRHAFKQEMMSSADKITRRMAKVHTRDEKRNIILDELLDLKRRYFDFIRDLKEMQAHGLVKFVRDSNNNLIFLICSRYKLKATASLKYKSLVQIDVQADRDQEFLRTVLDIGNIRRYIQGGILWQKHLLTIKTEAEEALGMEAEVLDKTLYQRLRHVLRL